MSKKRGQGEGSIYKRKDGLWVGQVTIQGKKVYKYSRLKREVREWLKEIRDQVQNGLTYESAQITLDNYLDVWLNAHKLSVRPKTIAQYRQIVHMHIIPFIGNIKLKDLRPDQIQKLYDEKMKSGTGARTVRLIHAVLHRALKQALLWGLIGRNPSDAVITPKYIYHEMQVLNEEQVHIFLSIASSSRYYMLYWLALATGLRQGELLGLKWSDLNYQNRSLQIQRQLQRLKTGLVFSEPKSKASRRVVLLGGATIDKLKQHNEDLQKEKALVGDRWQESDLIFPSTVGTPTGHSNLSKGFKKILRDANLPNIRFHDLRHTAATLMLKQGVHPKVVQERLGHSDITLTLNTYSHVLPTMQKEVADKMDNLLDTV